MEVSDIVNLFVNNGTAIAVIIYFCVRDWKFQNTLVETLTTLKTMLAEMERKEKE